MTTAAPVSKVDPAQPLLPPDEQFWQRYSPHGEMGISGTTSLVLHILILVIVFFGALLVPWWLSTPSGKMLVQTVKRSNPNPLGGGGKPGGIGDGPGLGALAAPMLTNKEEPALAQPLIPDSEPPRLDSSTAKVAPPELRPDPESERKMERGNNADIFKQIDATAMKKLRQGITPGAGKGGPGRKGGKDAGDGTDKGKGVGDATATLDPRVVRMLRWVMQFETRNGPDYLAQLRSLDAILAIPMDKEGKQYKIIRDLSGQGPAKLLDEDLDKIQRIFWTDARPGSVKDMAGALGLKFVPQHFIAFMPEKLEAKLFELEKSKAGNRPEDEIDETKFKMERQPNGAVVPVILSVTFKK